MERKFVRRELNAGFVAGNSGRPSLQDREVASSILVAPIDLTRICSAGLRARERNLASPI